MSAEEVSNRTFDVDLSSVYKDNVISSSELQSFILDRVQNKFKYAKQFQKITVSGTSSKVTVMNGGLFTKPYLRFLLKNFIGKKEVQNYVRLTADGADSFAFRYYSEEDGADAQDN